MMPMLEHDALVLGGGLAGSAIATILARAGKHTVLIEKNKDPQHKVCGEFLSPECIPFLHELGICPEELGAQIIHSLRVVLNDVVCEVPLQNWGYSITRRALDEALLQRAQSAGVNLLRGYTVDKLCHSEEAGVSGSWMAQITSSSQASLLIHGEEVFLATGKHDLRGWSRLTQGTHHTLVAMKMYFLLSPEQFAKLSGNVELFMYPGGYAGLQAVENGHANLCALISSEKLRALDGRWDALLEYMQAHSRHLASRLRGSIPQLSRPVALSCIPYGYCTDVGGSRDASPWRLGDQAAVIPSFCGDGMAIALYTANRAAQLFLGGSSVEEYHSEVSRVFRRRLRTTALLSRVATSMPWLAYGLQLRPSVLTEIFKATRLPTACLTNVMKI
jgi:flavin-dependent dehydrogenase